MVSYSRLWALVACLAACGTPDAGAQDMFTLFTKDETRVPRERLLPEFETRRFSPENPARIMVIGDSLAEGIGLYMGRLVGERGIYAQVQNRGRNSSGLARSDFYDWPAQFEVLAATQRPDIVVAHFGANDMQTIILPDGSRARFGTEEWDATYRAQIRRILDIAARNKAMLWWVGPGPDRGTNLNRHLGRINPLFQDEAQMVGAVYLPLAPLAAGPTGEYVTDVSLEGRSVRIRTGDGSHYTGAGYTLVVDRILDSIEPRAPSIFGTGGELLVALQ